MPHLPLTPASRLQPILAGLLASLVGFASTFTIILAALVALGATPHEAGSGLLALCLAVGALNIIGSWRSRIPLSFAWTTPGAAFLVTAGAPEGGFPVAVGGFVVAGLMIALAGLVRPLARLIGAIPAPIANAMLAGMLLTLCLAPLRALGEAPLHALPILFAWALGLRFARRFAVPIAVLVTGIVLALSVELPAGGLSGAWPALVPVLPQFTLDAILRIALPLFIVTMASQNLPGLAVMQANGYHVAPGPTFLATGLGSVFTAFLGGLSINLAAITAAITASAESHPDPRERWIGPVAAGCGYFALGAGASLAAAFIAAAPPILIEAVAGLALLGSLAAALGGALGDNATRLPAILTFVTTASGLTLLGLGAPFWGLVIGIGLMLILKPARRRPLAEPLP